MRAESTYFERPVPVGLVFGAFFTLALPLSLLTLIPNDVAWLPYLVLLEAVGLGTSHFFLTAAVYLDAQHRTYFNETLVRRLVYFGAPAAILLGFASMEAAALRVSRPALTAYVFAAVRLLDFMHVGRQSVGMLQLFKRPLAARLPRWTRTAENALFVGLGLLQWHTYLGGGTFALDSNAAELAALLLACLFGAIAARYLVALRAASVRELALPCGYLCIQTYCAALAAYATWLYLSVLAVHYVEYHVVMMPRWVRTRADGQAPGLFQRAPVVLYALLLSVVVLFELRSIPQPASASLRFIVHVFDGIFVVHYVLDAFLWKFGQPFYAKRLAPLYFSPGPARSALARKRPRAYLQLAAGALLAALAWFAPGSRALRVSFERRVIDPVRVEHHLRWAMRLAEAGELERARVHAREAEDFALDDPRPRQLLHMLQAAGHSLTQAQR